MQSFVHQIAGKNIIMKLTKSDKNIIRYCLFLELHRLLKYKKKTNTIKGLKIIKKQLKQLNKTYSKFDE